MDFKFNFSVGGDSAAESNAKNAGKLKTKPTEMEKTCECRKFHIKDILNHCSPEKLPELCRVNAIAVDEMLSFMTVTTGEETETTDLIPRVYEGGFKVWECTLDLIRYLRDVSEDLLKGKRALDLGCGVGLLGIYALAVGAERVTFQDYNESVILRATGPSAITNLFERMERCPQDGAIERKSPEKSTVLNVGGVSDYGTIAKNDDFVNLAMEKMDFWSGDWSALSDDEAFTSKMYDVILSSETIYNTSCYETLHYFLRTCLNPEGIIYMGAKSHYFGVGGGVSSWCDYVNTMGVFDIDIVETITTGLKRHILRLCFKK